MLIALAPSGRVFRRGRRGRSWSTFRGRGSARARSCAGDGRAGCRRRAAASGRGRSRRATDLVTFEDPRLGTIARDVDVVLDFVRGETTGEAMAALISARSDREQPLSWVQIGSVTGPGDRRRAPGAGEGDRAR